MGVTQVLTHPCWSPYHSTGVWQGVVWWINIHVVRFMILYVVGQELLVWDIASFGDFIVCSSVLFCAFRVSTIFVLVLLAGWMTSN